MNVNSITKKLSQKAHLLFLATLFIGSTVAAQVSPGVLIKDPATGNGSVSSTVDGCFTVTGSDNSDAIGFVPANTAYQFTALSEGMVTFTWSYVTRDCNGPSFDRAYYTVDGVRTQLTTNNGGNTQAGTSSISFTVMPGQTYSFGVLATDNFCGSADLTICSSFLDFSCGKNGEKIQVCHKEGNGTSHTICISRDALADHLAHGDTVGPCGTEEKTHPNGKNSNNAKQTEEPMPVRPAGTKTQESPSKPKPKP